MAGARSFSSSSESEALSIKSCSVGLDSSLPDSVNEMSQCLESSVGHDRHNEEADEPAEADSDSGDSLFMTQISAPEAERTRRRRRSPRSDPASSGDLEGSGSDASLSDSPKVSTSTRVRRRLLIRRLPKYRFSFVSGEKGKLSGSVLRNGPNFSLNNCIMGGFFKCVREQWIMRRGGGDDDKSTVDMDGECISPLSEEEEERSEDEDIKVVERKCFVAPSKAKKQQSWSNHLKQEKTTRNGGKARRETSQRRRCKTREKGDETMSLQQRAREEELRNDGDAAVCEAPKKRTSSRLCAQKHIEASTTATEPQTDVLLHISQTENEHDSPDLFESLPDLQSDTNNDSEPGEKNGKKEKKGGDHESTEEEEEKGHGREEPEGLHAATSALQTSDELEFNERNCLEDSLHDNSRARQEEGDVPDSKQKKKKRKKSAAENVSQETDANLESGARVEDSGFSESCNVENGGKKKKKKRKRSGEDEEHLQSREDAELLSDDAEMKKKKKKRKKEKTVIEEEKELNRALDLPPVSTGQVEELGNGLENTTAHEETLESSCVKRKSLKKKKKLSFSDDAAQDKEEFVEVSFSNDAVTLEESTDMSLKKKKKKKKTISEEVDISHAPEENEKVECKDNTQQTKEGLEADAELTTKIKKKKKKKKTNFGEVDITHIPEENEKVECKDDTQQTKEGLEADAELVTKKKKKKKKKTNSEEVDISHISEENETVEDDTQKIKDAEKKKKRGEENEIFGRNISEDSVAQSDDSVSLRKKEKKKKRTASFLAADVEENGLQTHGGQNRLDFETESAETGGNLEESINGVGKKKKKKRKRKVSEEQDGVENDHEMDFGEPKETCQSALPETVDTGVKRKKMKKKSVDQACHEIQGSPPTATENGNQTLSDIKEKKRTKRTDDNLLEGHSELQLQESKKKKKKERNKQSAVPDIVSSSPALSETSVLTSTTSFSDSIMKKKQKKVKHALH